MCIRDRLEAVRRKNEKLTRQVGVLFKCMVYVRNQTRHLLAMVEAVSYTHLKKEVKITTFEALPDDMGRYAFFIKAENEPSFAVYPNKMCIRDR